MKDKIAFLIIGILIGVIITTGGFFVYNKTISNNPERMQMNELGGVPPNGEMGEPPERPDEKPGMHEEKTEKETLASDIDEGTEVLENQIDLSEFDTNITIKKSGEYTLTGEFKHAVLVNAESDVTLILNGVDIKNEVTSAIANISENDLLITLADNSINNLSDGGSSEYDGCIYSNGNLTIDGSGTLNVYGNQEEGEGIAAESKDITINSGIINIECEDDGINAGGDGGLITMNGGDIFIKANGDGIDSNKNLIINGGNIYTMGSAVGGDSGIDTDEGFEINGGNVIALGSDMLEKPENYSEQKSICFTLKEKIDSESEIKILNDNEEEIVAFEAKENFKTLIVSNEKIMSGTYYLYKDGEKTEYTVQI